ncbi:MAG TPA: hypothetical protein VKT52_10055 [Ktedonobacterales bacterium]|nr:hypothetical protein [Ktedonobacterales bacterium]
MSTQFDPTENNLPQVPPAAASGSDETIDVLNGETTRDSEREQHITDSVADGAENEAPAKPRSRRGRNTRAARREQPEAEATSTTPGATTDGILQLPVRGEAQPPERRDESEESGESDETVVVAELEAQGFTADEAIRLVHVSDRVATSREAREAEATLRRLRFTRWLVERGVLDEFSA